MAGLCTVLGVLAAAAPSAVADAPDGDRLTVYGDVRTRLESDFDSRRADGTPRDDRTRLRARVRVGLVLRGPEGWTLGARLRSGSEASQQSPHVTLLDFDGNDTGPADFSLDRWFARGAWGRGWAWAGRNDLPFWSGSELAWDSDVTVAGLAGGTTLDAGGGALAVSAGVFALPVGMQAFSGRLAAGQLHWRGGGAGAQLDLAASVLDIDPDADDPDAAALLDGNGARPYRLLAGAARLQTDAARLPLEFGAELIRNIESYAAVDPDPFTAANRDERTGYAVSAFAGSAREPGGWQIGWRWARIETLAVNASYAQDDWVRWGTASQTRASGFRGHELRATWRASQALELVARAFFVEALGTLEDGSRVRVASRAGRPTRRTAGCSAPPRRPTCRRASPTPVRRGSGSS